MIANTFIYLQSFRAIDGTEWTQHPKYSQNFYHRYGTRAVKNIFLLRRHQRLVSKSNLKSFSLPEDDRNERHTNDQQIEQIERRSTEGVTVQNKSVRNQFQQQFYRENCREKVIEIVENLRKKKRLQKMLS